MEKQEIIETRVGGLGSSDAKMIAKIGKNGIIGESDKKRIAIMLGLDKQIQFSSVETDHGNFIEQCIFDFLQEKYPDIISNPYYESKKLSKKYGFKIFNHIDFEIINNCKLIWFECKDSKKSTDDIILKEYFDQLNYHYILGQEKAKKLKLDFELYLVHYFDIEKEYIFNLNNIIIREVKFFDFDSDDLFSGLDIISKAIQTFEYEKKDEFLISDLPAVWQNECENIQNILLKQKEENKKIDDFKQKLLEIMEKNNIKSIKNEYFNLTYVPETVSVSFDKDALKTDLPEVFRKYNNKKTVKKSYIITKLK